MSTFMMIVLLLIAASVYSQQKQYDHADTVIQYKDAQIIIVKNKKDTIYYDRLKKNMTIVKTTEVMIIRNKRKLKRIRQ